MNLLSGIKSFLQRKRDDQITSWRSPLYQQSQFTTYNPDSLVQRKGIEIYRKMIIDDQVKACMAIKRITIYSKGWKVNSASDKPKDKRVSEFCEFALTDGLIGSFTKSLKGILTAFHYGFSITEKIPHIIKKGEFAGKITFKRIRTRPPDGFEFQTDDYGDLEFIKQWAEKEEIIIQGTDLNKLIIYSYDSEFGDIWGNSDLRAAYRHWWSKDVLIKFMNIYLERFGMGIVIGKYPRGMGGNAQDDLEKMIKNIQAKTAFKLPKDVEVAILESKTRGQASFIEAIEHCNKSISRSVLLPDKLGYTDSPGGSYNLGENQFSLFLMMMDNQRAEIQEEVVDEQILKDLVDKNFSNVSEYPHFSFNPLTQADKIQLAERYIDAVDKGVITHTEKDEDYFRKSIDYPQRDMESPVLERPVKPAPSFGGGNPQLPAPTGEADNIAKFQKTLSRLPNKFESKIDFKKTVDELDELEDKSATQIGKDISRISEDLINSITSRKIVEEKKVKEVEKLKLKHLGDLRFTFGQMLLNSFKLGKKHGFRDVAAKKAGVDLQQVPLLTNLPPKEILAFFEAKKFRLTGAERDHILNNTKGILFNSIKSGQTNTETIFQLEEFFEKYKVEQKLPTGQKVRVEKIPARIETIIRTNTNEAYNQGRLTAFQDPLVSDIIAAYEYSAIMDGRTSEICASYDGNIYKTSDTTWDTIIPPNHHQCRSTIIPVLTDEKFKVSSPPKVDPALGFGGVGKGK